MGRCPVYSAATFQRAQEPALTDFATTLHWGIAWLLLPLGMIVAADGALREDLSRGSRHLLGWAVWLTLATLALRVARHGMVNWHIPKGVWLAAPVAMALGLVVTANMVEREQKLLVLAFFVGLAVTLMGWVASALLMLGGKPWLVACHNTLLVLASIALIAGLVKQRLTRRASQIATPASPPSENDLQERGAELQRRLASAEAQEAADKYTRE